VSNRKRIVERYVEGFRRSDHDRPRLIEEDDRVVATGGGSVAEEGGKSREFVFCEVFSFTGNAVSRLDTYHVWLT
jgi:shikimate kinase